MLEITRVCSNYMWLICILITIIGIVYSCLVTFFIFRFELNPSSINTQFPSVTLLKPLHLAEAGLEINLSSFCEQDYPAPIQIIFGVSSPLDTAFKIAKDIQIKYPHLNISLVCDDTQHGENNKISNLINMFKLRQHTLLIVSDSDIRVEKDYLKTIAAAIAEERVGIVSFYYRGLPLKGFWSRMTASYIDNQFFPSTLFGTTLGVTTPCFGSTLALSENVLTSIGGFENFSSDLADDYAMGQRVQELGLKIRLAPQLLKHSCSEENFLEYFRHLIRWGQTIRSINPLGYLGSFVIFPLPFAMCASVLNYTDLKTHMFLAVTLASRLLIPLQMKYKFQAEGSSLALLPLSDLLSFLAYLVSFMPLKIEWRGKKYQLEASGKLKKV